MGNLVFQATLGGQVNLVGPNTASTFNLNVPAVAGTLVTTGDTGTVTNTMCATSVYTAPGTIGSGTPNSGAFTTLSASSTTTLSGGTANGVAYLNGSKVVTTGSALVFDGANLGLGVTPSAWYTGGKALQIFNGSGGSLNAYSGEFFINQNAYLNSDASNWIRNDAGYASQYHQVNSKHIWKTAASSSAGSTISFTAAMTLDASGNLGVGTTSPVYKLDVSASSGNGIRYTATSTSATIYMGDNSGVPFLSTGTASALTFGTQSTERARIDSSGNLLVGTTDTNGTQGFMYNIANQQIALGHTNGTASGTRYINFLYNASSIGSITQNGTTGVLYNLTSDYRLKNNPVPVTGAKEFVMALQPKTWDWWDGSGKGVGFIAHEFMEVAQYSGNGEKDAVDENGNPVYQSIQPSSSEVMAYLVAHIQNLETRLAALEQV